MADDQSDEEPNIDPADLPDDVGTEIEKDVDPEEVDE